MTATERLKEYENLFQRSQQYDPTKYQQEFEKAYGEATNYNADLIGQRAEAIGQAQALPSELRASYAQSAIRNPLEQEALIAQRRGNVTSDISRLTDLLGARGSRYQDVLSSYLQAYQTDAQRAQTAAENQWRLYQDALAREEAERARARAAAQAAALEQFLRDQYSGGDDLVIETEDDPTPAPVKKTWLQKTGDIGDKYGLRGTDFSTASPTLKNVFLAGFNPFQTIRKTLGGAIGNLGGNWSRDDMSFWEKLYDRR